MQIACDSCPGGFLSVDQAAGELPNAFVARSERRVARTSDFLSTTPARVLSQQPANEKRLENEERDCAEDVPAVQLPRGGFPELNDRFGGETRHIDAPSAELAPIEGGYQPVVLDRDVLSAYTIQNLERQLSDAGSDCLRVVNDTADNSLTHIGGLNAVYRYWRSLGNDTRNRVGEDDIAGILFGIADVEHDAAGRSPFDCGRQPRYGRFVEVYELDGRRHCPELGVHLIQKVCSGRLGDDEHLFRGRMQLQCELKRVAIGNAYHHAGKSSPRAAAA